VASALALLAGCGGNAPPAAREHAAHLNWREAADPVLVTDHAYRVR
jgi:hypothetical protein